MAYKVIIPEDISALGKDFLQDKGYEIVVGNGNISVEYLKELVADADAILVRPNAPYPEEVLSAAKKLKVIGVHGVDYGNIDTDYCVKRRIPITTTPAATCNAVAERTLGFIMSLAHQIPFMDQQVRHDNWGARYEHKGTELKGKTLGLIGLGRIGSLVARKATNGLDMKVIAYDEFLVKNEYAGFVTCASSMEEVLAKSDFVSLHVPVTVETTGMINQETLRLMKPNAYLINCARGELVNEEALHETLKSGVINGAALDVFQEEPIAQNHPFFELDNLIMTPHNAIITHEALDLMGYHAAVGIDDVLNGRQPQWQERLLQTAVAEQVQ